MDCNEVEAHLPLFVGGDLEAPLQALVGTHLTSCGECAARNEAMRAAREALLGLQASVGEAREIDLWPAVRAGLVAEGLLHQAELPVTAAAPQPGRWGKVLRFSRAFGALAAASLAVLLWQPWGPASSPSGVSEVSGPAWNISQGGDPAVAVAPGADSAPATSGLVVPVAGPGVATATPALPGWLEGEAARTDRLRRAGPGDELLRDAARTFPDAPFVLRPMTVRGQGGWSLASDSELR